MTAYPLMIVGEAWGAEEAKEGRPFVGASGSLLRQVLSRCGIDIKHAYLTNVFNLKPEPTNDISNLCGPKDCAVPGLPRLANGKYVRAEFKPELDRLYYEVESVRPNLILALGSTASWALTKVSGIRKIRGAPLVGHAGVKVLPTYHPAAILREFSLRAVLFADCKKAAREMQFPELVRPQREFWLEPTLEDLALFEPYILESNKVSVDIETWQRQITCIGFAPSPGRAIVIPFCTKAQPDGNYWRTLEEELIAWNYVRSWLRRGPKVVGQNFLYDARYLWERYGIPPITMAEDTMLKHHALYPELEKGLGFLGSIYTDEPAWKFMRSGGTLKKED